MATVDEVIQLMEAMARNRVGLLEWDGLKLQAALPERPLNVLSAASGISAPTLPITPRQEATPQQAMKAVQEARIAAGRFAEEQLSKAQTKTANARRKAVGGIGAGTGSMIEGIYKEALKTTPPGERARSDG